jgi:rare lipoprotein A
MKQQLIGSLTATLLVSALGALPSHAQQFEDSVQSANKNIQASDSADWDGTPVSPPAADDLQSETASVTLAASPDIVLVNAHPLDNRQAATLYVHNIPVLTFLGGAMDGLNTVQNDKALSPNSLESDPVFRATAIGAHINQLYQDQVEAESISVRWVADRQQYVITIGTEELVALNGSIILPDTTNDAAEDALQATNRLRRLLGGAAPLTTIEGRPRPAAVAVLSSTRGVASWYGPGFHGRRSASGEVFNQSALTAAHRSLPFGTRVRVTNLNTGQQVIVRINDRGPYSGGRIIDLSAAAARQIGLMGAGVGPVQLEVLGNAAEDLAAGSR